MPKTLSVTLIAALLTIPWCGSSIGQVVDAVQLGSSTAKGGFRNEDDIRDKFNQWASDKDAQSWLRAMGYGVDEIRSVNAEKPHGYKADVEVRITTREQVSIERISIKLVSTTTGFNQIDKRWVKDYAAMWELPSSIQESLRLYVGETPPTGPSRREGRMYLDELSDVRQKAVFDFFRDRKETIVSDLIAGDGDHAASWFMVTLKSETPPRWILKPIDEVVAFFAEGDVRMTRFGNLKLGRISMQRKGGDNGRETAKMLQFKMNPAELLDTTTSN